MTHEKWASIDQTVPSIQKEVETKTCRDRPQAKKKSAIQKILFLEFGRFRAIWISWTHKNPSMGPILDTTTLLFDQRSPVVSTPKRFLFRRDPRLVRAAVYTRETAADKIG